MTDAATPSEPEYPIENDPDGLTVADFETKDWVLQSLLDLIFGPLDENQDASFNLTLDVGGTIVTGLAITEDAWSGLVAKSVGVASSRHGETFEKILTALSGPFKEMAKERSETDTPIPPRKFVHLRDVSIHGGGTTIITADLWRATLSDVTGWTVGSHS